MQLAGAYRGKKSSSTPLIASFKAAAPWSECTVFRRRRRDWSRPCPRFSLRTSAGLGSGGGRYRDRVGQHDVFLQQCSSATQVIGLVCEVPADANRFEGPTAPCYLSIRTNRVYVAHRPHVLN